MGDRDLFDEDDGAGPASCSPKVLPKKEVIFTRNRHTPTRGTRSETVLFVVMGL